MAVQLQLPQGARLHDVFHVRVLKKVVDTPPATTPALPPTHNGAVVPAPDKITAARVVCGVQQVMVQLKEEPMASANWEDFDDFCSRFPTFQLEDWSSTRGEMSCAAAHTQGAREPATCDGRPRGRLGRRKGRRKVRKETA